jgi:hypothetical protein
VSSGNYIAGSCNTASCGSDNHYHDFFVIDLSSVSGTVTAASLQLENPSGGGPGNTYTLYDVTSSTSALTAGTAGTAGYADLGSGTSYGSVAVPDTSATPITVPLNTAGIAAVQGAVGSSSLAIGGDFAPLVATSTDDYLFASTTPSYAVSLILTVSPCTHTVSGSTTSVTVSGTTCVSNATVNSGINVRSGASLVLTNSTVNGSVYGNGAKSVTICGSRINGALSVENSTGPVLVGDAANDESPACAGNTIQGSALVKANTADTELGANHIAQSATFQNNTGSSAGEGPEVGGNTINASLVCSGNASPVTDDGVPNHVTTAKTGQCAGL